MRKNKLWLKISERYFIPVTVVLVLIAGYVFSIPRHARDFFALVIQDSPSVVNFGDIMLDRGVRRIMEKGRDPFEHIKKDIGLIRGYDVVLANLEGPIVEMDRAKCQQKAYNFQFPKTTPDILKSVGITMVNIANNHAFDCYRTGFESTKKLLTDAGIEYIGDTNVEKSFVVKEIDGKRLAFVGMDETVQSVPLSNFYPLIKKLDAENDFVIVNIHWGTEYSLVATDVQKQIAHTLIDSGADVIIGHHPHVIEPVEIYKNKAIFYSLGNFVFDQTAKNTTDGLGVGMEFQDEKTVFTLYPYHLESFAPRFLRGNQLSDFCKIYLQDVSHEGCKLSISLLDNE